MIIDVHTHAFPDFLATKAMASLQKPLGDWKPSRDGTLTSLVESMDAAGVDRVLVASIATRPEQGPAIAQWSRQIASERIVPLGSVHPHSATWEAELEAISEAGLVGIKFHPQYQHFILDAEEVMPIYRKAASLGLFVLFHAGFDIAFPGNESAAPRRLAHVRHRIDNLVMIAAHVGGWQAWDEVLAHLVGRDVYLDTSYIHQIPQTQLEAILERHPHGRMLYASDSPWLSQRKSLEFVRKLPLDESAMRQVLGANAQQLHPLLQQSVSRPAR